MKLNIRFSISVFAGLALAVALLWLLAVWQPAAHAVAMTAPGVRANAAAALPEFTSRTVNVGDGDVGNYSSLVLNAAGNPVISYYDSVYEDLKVAVCGDPACSSVVATTVDDGGPEGNVGWDSSLALDAAGNPVISYYDSIDFPDDGALKVAVCEDATCTSVISTTVDTGNVGRYNSLVLNADGNPVIAYYDYANRALKVAVCENKTCTSAAINTVDSEEWVGEAPKS